MKKDEKLASAAKLVNEIIAAEYERLETLAKTEENDPILVEGETSAGYYCQMMADPKDVARIMLNYNYPIGEFLKKMLRMVCGKN